jgi:hypothetical protein
LSRFSVWRLVANERARRVTPQKRRRVGALQERLARRRFSVRFNDKPARTSLARAIIRRLSSPPRFLALLRFCAQQFFRGPTSCLRRSRQFEQLGGQLRFAADPPFRFCPAPG